MNALPSDRERLLELAEACEKASGPAYTLDCEIWDAIYPGERDERFRKLTAKGEPYHGRLGPADKDGYIQPLRPFTASLDAAMTLVPPEFRLTGLAETIVECPDPWRAILWERKRNTKKRPHGDGATPALALCAAALRARASQEPGS